MSFTKHPDFSAIAPWIQIQVYGRDGGPRKQRRRIELKRATPRSIVLLALGVSVRCPACAQEMKPFRFRKPARRGADLPQGIYFAAACPERPSKASTVLWRDMARDPATTVAELRAALLEAACSNSTCCKGGAASEEYEAVVAAVEAMSP